MYMIAVPSRGRSEKIVKGHMYNQFKDTGALSFFVREEEVRKYESEGLKVVHVPNEYNIAQKRMLMLQLAHAKGLEHLFVLDDDIKLDIRRTDVRNKFRLCEPTEIPTFIEKMTNICGAEYPLVHPVQRFHADKKKYLYEKNCPAIRLVCYHVPTFIKENIKIDGLGAMFMEDRYVQLTLLNKGYRTIAVAGFCVDDVGGSNSKGGCSIYRTVEEHNKSARAIKKAFPDHVTLKVKQNGNWTEPRIDTMIQWKKFLDKGELPYIPKEEIENAN